MKIWMSEWIECVDCIVSKSNGIDCIICNILLNLIQRVVGICQIPSLNFNANVYCWNKVEKVRCCDIKEYIVIDWSEHSLNNAICSFVMNYACALCTLVYFVQKCSMKSAKEQKRMILNTFCFCNFNKILCAIKENIQEFVSILCHCFLKRSALHKENLASKILKQIIARIMSTYILCEVLWLCAPTITTTAATKNIAPNISGKWKSLKLLKNSHRTHNSTRPNVSLLPSLFVSFFCFVRLLICVFSLFCLLVSFT